MDLKQGFYNMKGEPIEFADSHQISSSNYILQEAIQYVAKNGDKYTVNEGFMHDGASKAFLKRFGKYTNAAILHDAIYRSNIVSRSKADSLFLEAMKFSGVSTWRAYTYYVSVRSLGYFSFKKTEKEKEAGLRYISVIKAGR